MVVQFFFLDQEYFILSFNNNWIAATHYWQCWRLLHALSHSHNLLSFFRWGNWDFKLVLCYYIRIPTALLRLLRNPIQGSLYPGKRKLNHFIWSYAYTIINLICHSLLSFVHHYKQCWINILQINSSSEITVHI